MRRNASSFASPLPRALRQQERRPMPFDGFDPASDSPRKGTAALISRRYGRYRDPHMDDRRDCRDTAPACVPSTCWARRRCGTAKFEIGAVPAPRKQQATTRHPGRQSARRRPAEQQHQLKIGSPFEAPLPARANVGKRPGRHPAPDRRGFRPPSTPGIATRSSCCRASESCPVRPVNPFNGLATERFDSDTVAGQALSTSR